MIQFLKKVFQWYKSSYTGYQEKSVPLYLEKNKQYRILNQRKQLTFRDATTAFLAKWRLRNECRNSILMTHQYPDLARASDWLKQKPIRRPSQISVVTRHQYGISALVPQTSFQWWRRVKSAVFLGYKRCLKIDRMFIFLKIQWNWPLLVTKQKNPVLKNRKGNSTAVVFHFVSVEQEYDNFKT